MSYRIERVNNLIRREMSDLLQRHVKDPRLAEFIAVTEVRASPDLRYAKVFVTSMVGEEEKKKIMEALKSATAFLRIELSRNLKMRRVPELTFHWDDSIERGDRVTRLIDEVSAKEE